jgi:predicted small lipoprotein YifL
MSRPNISIAMLCLAYAVVSGCGTKGPLYIPEQRYPQKATTETSKVTPQALPDAAPPAKAY